MTNEEINMAVHKIIGEKELYQGQCPKCQFWFAYDKGVPDTAGYFCPNCKAQRHILVGVVHFKLNVPDYSKDWEEYGQVLAYIQEQPWFMNTPDSFADYIWKNKIVQGQELLTFLLDPLRGCTALAEWAETQKKE